MRLRIEKEPLKRFLKWSQRVLFAGAILLLGYYAFVRVDAWLFQRRQSQELARQLPDESMPDPALAQPEPATSAPASPVLAAGGLVGRIEIPRLRLSAVVSEGVGQTTLRRAVGHIPGTSLPGQSGTVGLAAHRDTYFRALRNVKVKDEIRVDTKNGKFQYEVTSLSVVEPENITVLDNSGENVLTLVTCYPFDFVGPAPKRWIVRARQVSLRGTAESIVK